MYISEHINPTWRCGGVQPSDCQGDARNEVGRASSNFPNVRLTTVTAWREGQGLRVLNRCKKNLSILHLRSSPR